jgi:hypothetical protein
LGTGIGREPTEAKKPLREQGLFGGADGTRTLSWDESQHGGIARLSTQGFESIPFLAKA